MRIAPAVLSAAIATVFSTVFAGGALLAQGNPEATQPQVIARQDAMKLIARNMKVLSDMASGKAAFDAAAARTAAGTVAEEAPKVATLFQPEVTEAASEASPKVWTDWAGFLAHAEDLSAGASAIDPSSAAALQSSLGAAGGTCRACHTDYRL